MGWITRSLGALLLTSAAWAADTTALAPTGTPAMQTPLGNASVAPSLKAAAERDGVVLLGVAKNEKRSQRVGDAVVVWVGATNGKTNRQWLMEFRRGARSKRDKKTSSSSDITKYLSWGPTVTFSSEAEAIEVWIAGPVDMSDSQAANVTAAAAKRLRVSVPGDYLRLGLDNSARVDLQIRRIAAVAEREKRPLPLGQIYSLEKPVNAKAIAWARPVAEQLGFTPETDRAWVGGYVTLQAFYDMANDVPELREIASVAVEKPAVWKLAKLATGTSFRAGFGGGQTRPVDPAPMGLMPVALEAFAVPFSMSFGDDPMVAGEMVVVAPLPPLDVTAGILGLIAVNPHNPKRMVHLVVIGAVSGRDDGIAGEPLKR